MIFESLIATCHGFFYLSFAYFFLLFLFLLTLTNQHHLPIWKNGKKQREGSTVLRSIKTSEVRRLTIRMAFGFEFGIVEVISSNGWELGSIKTPKHPRIFKNKEGILGWKTWIYIPPLANDWTSSTILVMQFWPPIKVFCFPSETFPSILVHNEN